MKLVDKLEKAPPAIEARRGPFLLVGLFLREESPGPWDLVVSAPWLDDRKLGSLPLHKVGRDLFGLPVEEAYVLRAQTAARNVRELAAR